MQFDELGKVHIIQRVRLTHIAARVKLVVPNFTCRSAFLKEKHHGFYARALKRAARAVEHCVQVAAFKQELTQAHRGIIGVGQESVLNNYPGAAPAGLALAFREKAAGLGLSLRAPRLRKPCFWLLVPAAMAAGAFGASSSDLGSFYPYSRDLIGRVREAGIGPLMAHLAAYVLLYYAPWEFFFRGFLLFPFALAAERSFAAGRGPASDGGEAAVSRGTVLAALVLFQTIPSTLLHFGHPLAESAGAVAAGLVFGILAWKTRSIVPGLVLHASLGIGTDAFAALKGAGLL